MSDREWVCVECGSEHLTSPDHVCEEARHDTVLALAAMVREAEASIAEWHGALRKLGDAIPSVRRLLEEA